MSLSRGRVAWWVLVLSWLVLFLGQLARGGEEAFLVAVLVSSPVWVSFGVLRTRSDRVDPLVVSLPVLVLSVAFAALKHERALSVVWWVLAGIVLLSVGLNVVMGARDR